MRSHTNTVPWTGLPAGACDCHVHVFDPQRYAYQPGRAYTPGIASVADLEALHSGLGISRVVVVQPSVYGTNNQCLMSALRQLGPTKARGIAVIDPQTTGNRELRALHEAGVRGVRLNLHVQGGSLERARQQIAALYQALHMPGWCLQVHASLDTNVSLFEDFRRLKVPVVLDHYAGGLMPDPFSAELLDRLLNEIRTGNLYVKLSAPYRLWQAHQADELAQSIHAVAPHRVLWGSDWPHTGGTGAKGRSPEAMEPFRDIDNAEVLHRLTARLPDGQAVQRLLVDNPAELYGF